MAVKHSKEVAFFVTASDLAQAEQRALDYLRGGLDVVDDCIFEEEADARNAAWNARKYMFSTGERVFRITLHVRES